MSEEEAPHVVIVDDDEEIRNLLAQFLQQHGYDVSTAAEGEAMFAVLNQRTVDLIVLDIMLPGDDGFALCRRLRQQSSIPIIMLTAVSEETDCIIGLELGADDYMTKPFNPRTLLARIKAVMRRGQTDQQDSHDQHCTLKFIDWRLDQNKRHLISPDNVKVELSAGEYDLLVVFLNHPQRVLSRDQLLELTKGRSLMPYDRSIDVQISRLRHKIEDDPKHPEIIKTVRGGGYVLASQVEKV